MFKTRFCCTGVLRRYFFRFDLRALSHVYVHASACFGDIRGLCSKTCINTFWCLKTASPCLLELLGSNVDRFDSGRKFSSASNCRWKNKKTLIFLIFLVVFGCRSHKVMFYGGDRVFFTGLSCLANALRH